MERVPFQGRVYAGLGFVAATMLLSGCIAEGRPSCDKDPSLDRVVFELVPNKLLVDVSSHEELVLTARFTNCSSRAAYVQPTTGMVSFSSFWFYDTSEDDNVWGHWQWGAAGGRISEPSGRWPVIRLAPGETYEYQDEAFRPSSSDALRIRYHARIGFARDELATVSREIVVLVERGP